MSTENRLKRAFVEDHRKLTRGYRDIRKALQADAVETAKQLADDLDRMAGPHIEFEERYLYPVVEEHRGESYAANLYSEHSMILQAIRGLKEAQTASEEQKSQWLRGMDEGLRHAATCGTLLSYLVTLPEQEQDRLLAHLERLRNRGCRWSELRLSDN